MKMEKISEIKEMEQSRVLIANEGEMIIMEKENRRSGDNYLSKMLANNDPWEPIADTDQHSMGIEGIARSWAETALLDHPILASVPVWKAIGETGQAELVSRHFVFAFQVEVRPGHGLAEPGNHLHVDTCGL